MKHLQNAADEVINFFLSDSEICLVTGTDMTNKHTVVLEAIRQGWPEKGRILFRSSQADNTTTFLSSVVGNPNQIKHGKSISFNGKELFADSINSASWKKTPMQIDVAVIYCADSLNEKEGEKCIEDLKRRGAKKVVMVVWSDEEQLDWANPYNPYKIVIDDPNSPGQGLSQHLRTSQLDITQSKLPAYAQSTPVEYLIKMFCKGRCMTVRWGKLNKQYPGKQALKEAEMGEFYAVCLQCGFRANDNYNWNRG